jgi:hypothetical protein
MCQVHCRADGCDRQARESICRLWIGENAEVWQTFFCAEHHELARDRVAHGSDAKRRMHALVRRLGYDLVGTQDGLPADDGVSANVVVRAVVGRV